MKPQSLWTVFVLPLLLVLLVLLSQAVTPRMPSEAGVEFAIPRYQVRHGGVNLIETFDIYDVGLQPQGGLTNLWDGYSFPTILRPIEDCSPGIYDIVLVYEEDIYGYLPSKVVPFRCLFNLQGETWRQDHLDFGKELIFLMSIKSFEEKPHRIHGR